MKQKKKKLILSINCSFDDFINMTSTVYKILNVGQGQLKCFLLKTAALICF